MPSIERRLTCLTHALEKQSLKTRYHHQLQALDTDRKIYALHGQIGENHQNMGKWELLSGAAGFIGSVASVGLKVAFDGKYAIDDRITDTVISLLKATSSYFQQGEQKEMRITENTARQEQDQHTDLTRKAADDHEQRKMEQLREMIHRNEARKGIS